MDTLFCVRMDTGRDQGKPGRICGQLLLPEWYCCPIGAQRNSCVEAVVRGVGRAIVVTRIGNVQQRDQPTGRQAVAGQQSTMRNQEIAALAMKKRVPILPTAGIE